MGVFGSLGTTFAWSIGRVGHGVRPDGTRDAGVRGREGAMNLAMVGGDPGARWYPAPVVQHHLSHEAFCHKVREIAVSRIHEEVTANLLLGAKLVYGVGTGRYRGICIYDKWHAKGQATAIIEIAAAGEESAIQLAGTTIHETAHVLAGSGAGHGKAWKEACQRLGLGGPEQGLAVAAGQEYDPSHFAPDILPSIVALGEPGDGLPAFRGHTSTWAPAPCPMGRGIRGGKSYGPGSGRLRLWECQCSPKPVKVRVASDDFRATCDRCGSAFEYQGS